MPVCFFPDSVELCFPKLLKLPVWPRDSVPRLVCERDGVSMGAVQTGFCCASNVVYMGAVAH